MEWFDDNCGELHDGPTFIKWKLGDLRELVADKTARSALIDILYKNDIPSNMVPNMDYLKKIRSDMIVKPYMLHADLFTSLRLFINAELLRPRKDTQNISYYLRSHIQYLTCEPSFSVAGWNRNCMLHFLFL